MNRKTFFGFTPFELGTILLGLTTLLLGFLDAAPISSDNISGITPVGQSELQLTVTGTNSFVMIDSTGNASMIDAPTARTALGLGPMATSTPTVNTNVTHTLVGSTSATGFQVSATRFSIVNYSISTTCTATIGGNSSVTVFLETAATNSTNPSDWTVVAQLTNGQAITLAAALQSIQTNYGVLTASVPAGYYTRLRYVITGIGSATYGAGQETLF